jgi:hypothetical protein
MILLAWIIDLHSFRFVNCRRVLGLVQPSAASATETSLVRWIRGLSSIGDAMDGFIRHDGSNRV